MEEVYLQTKVKPPVNPKKEFLLHDDQRRINTFIFRVRSRKESCLINKGFGLNLRVRPFKFDESHNKFTINQMNNVYIIMYVPSYLTLDSLYDILRRWINDLYSSFM